MNNFSLKIGSAFHRTTKPGIPRAPAEELLSCTAQMELGVPRTRPCVSDPSATVLPPGRTHRALLETVSASLQVRSGELHPLMCTGAWRSALCSTQRPTPSVPEGTGWAPSPPHMPRVVPSVLHSHCRSSPQNVFRGRFTPRSTLFWG